MKAKTQTTCILFCMMLLLSAVSEGTAEADSAITKAAEEGLQPFLNRIPQGELEKFGFAKEDSPDQAYTGSPFRLHTITPAALSAYQPGDSADSIISETGIWYFPVMLKNEIRAILIVDQIKGRWKAVSLGKAKLAGELAKVRKQWSERKGYNPLLIAVFQAGEYLFTVPEKDAYNLTPLMSVHRTDKRRSGQPSENSEYSDVDKLSDTVNRLKPAVEKNIRAYQ